jgi:uncharacterized membrane protein YdcZ (DUF606 family)
MDRNGAFALTIAASALVAAQAPINSHLGKAIGTFQAAFISFAIGTLALVVVVSFTGGFGQIHLTSVPWYYLTDDSEERERLRRAGDGSCASGSWRPAWSAS